MCTKSIQPSLFYHFLNKGTSHTSKVTFTSSFDILEQMARIFTTKSEQFNMLQ